MPKIIESIITTLNSDGSPHIAPMGIWRQDGFVVLAPFKPSTTLDNIQNRQCAVVNYTDDVRIFAGCLSGRYDWPIEAASQVDGIRLRDAATHVELKLDHIEEDELRPRFLCNIVHEQSHRPFAGFNRAQAAVLELAILVSRLHMLPAEKVTGEIEYLRIAIDKTAGEGELEAWGWLMERVDAHFKA